MRKEISQKRAVAFVLLFVVGFLLILLETFHNSMGLSLTDLDIFYIDLAVFYIFPILITFIYSQNHILMGVNTGINMRVAFAFFAIMLKYSVDRIVQFRSIEIDLITNWGLRVWESVYVDFVVLVVISFIILLITSIFSYFVWKVF